MPVLLSNGGPVLYLILLTSAVAVVVFIERFLHCHRAQINSTEFLNGVRTVLRLRSKYAEPRKTLADPAKYYDDSFYREAMR